MRPPLSRPVRCPHRRPDQPAPKAAAARLFGPNALWQGLLLTALALLAWLLPGGAAQAQVYRFMGADGRVTYSDKPPAINARQGLHTSGAEVTTLPIGSGSVSTTGLSYELRQLVQKYPVTFYTQKDCAVCAQGRAYLSERGIPFAEKFINTNDDLDAFKKQGFNGTLPALTISGKRITGYNPQEWASYLNAAGYPEQSALPPSYQQAEATPLTVPKPAGASAEELLKARAEAEAAKAKAKAPPPPPPPLPGPDPTTGIRF